MATSVIMPALEMAQETGRLISWLKREGEPVSKGEPLMEVETDKVTVELEAPASGVLKGVLARENDVVPVGQTIAWILEPGESVPAAAQNEPPSGRAHSSAPAAASAPASAPAVNAAPVAIDVSPVARKMAQEHGIDLAQVRPAGARIEKADLLAHINAAQAAPASGARLLPASPKARRLASERGIDIASLTGSGPDGAVLAVDVPLEVPLAGTAAAVEASAGGVEALSTVWRRMAERMSESWASVPHFYLVREVDASRLIEWRKRVTASVEKEAGVKPTFTDLLVRLIAFGLRDHPRLNAAWADGSIRWNNEINIGIATAVDDGLIVPVIHNAGGSSLGEIAARRSDLVDRARRQKLRPADISGGTFTLTNLGMYGVDAFDAIVNTPQAAILAVGRIADRVVPVAGQPVIRPMMVLTLSLDHRVVDGARAAQFLDELAALIEEPLGLLR